MKNAFSLPINKKTLFLLSFVLWVSIFSLYSKSIQFDFVDYDDTAVLLAHPNLYNEDSFTSSLKEILYNYFPREEPLILRDITWAMDSYFFGFKNPMGYHIGNVILNCFNVSFLFVFLYLTTQRVIFSLLVSITFGVLPVNVEPVCWVMGRKDLLVTFFMLCALIAQTLFLESEDDDGKRRVLYLGTLLFTMMALVSKINALTFFMVLAAHQVFYPFLSGASPSDISLDFNTVIKKILPRILPHFLISLYIYYWYNNIVSAFGLLGRGPTPFSAEHIKNLMIFIPQVLALYGKMIFFPFYDYSVSYYRPNVNLPLEPFSLFVSVLTILILLCLLIIAFRKRKEIFFYLITFTILMLPYCNIVYIGIWRANRYVYFSSFCILAALFSLIICLLKQRQNLRIAFFCIWILFTSTAIFYNNKYQNAWNDNHTLWVHETSLNDPSILSFEALAKSYVKKAEKEKDSDIQKTLLTKAESVIEKGITKYESLEFKSTNYYTPEIAYHSKLYYLKGQIAEIRGESLERQLQHYKKAYEFYSMRLNIFMLARTYYKMAMAPEKTTQEIKGLATLSLQHFAELINLTNDPHALKKYLFTLDQNYGKNFQFLSENLLQLKADTLSRIKGNHDQI